MKISSYLWGKDRVPVLYPHFQRGVLVKTRAGISLRALLCEQLGLSRDYVENRIQTAFLNGSPVDDFKAALVGPGSVLALSGAMPGLAGATLRKGGFFSPMRASLSHREDPKEGRGEEGFITIRVFNILLPELAPALLARGIYLKGEDFAALLRDLKAHGEINGEPGKGWLPLEDHQEEEWVPGDFVQIRI